MQVLRTYPAKRPAYPFAPDGERSVARAYLKAFGGRGASSTSRTSTSGRSAPPHALADALAREPELHVVVVVPRFPDRDGRVARPGGAHRA